MLYTQSNRFHELIQVAGLCSKLCHPKYTGVLREKVGYKRDKGKKDGGGGTCEIKGSPMNFNEHASYGYK
jgi:hypothetical protein